ncbi:uncharacterized protein [Phaseolus vulgaris]|uniref:uncharacterized protein n=1 Tax=Phaseolus vulgaris TaxID=3885 RepID=UPI0035C9C590
MSVEVFEDHSPDVDITFTKEDLRDVVPHDNDPIVISLVTAERTVHRVLVDQGSSADVMFWPTFKRLQLSTDQLRPYGGCLYGFAGDQVEVRGYIELRTTFTDGAASRTEKIKYLVVNAPSTYNILLGRPTLNRIGAVPSTRHMKVKLPSMEGVIVTIRSDQEEAKRCYENSLKNRRSVCHVTTTPPLGAGNEHKNRRAMDAASEGAVEGDVVMDVALEAATKGDVTKEDVEARSERNAQVEEEENCPETARESSIVRALLASEKRPRPVGDWLEREISDKTFKLGKTLDGKTQDQIAKVIGRHLDAFAWSASDMPGIDLDFLCHRLAMDPQVKPVRQRRRKFNEERRQAIRDETQKLLEAGHIKEIQYPECLANVVLVKKSNGKWRMCVDFKDLNKACPKDSYPLPSIDALVDSAAGWPRSEISGFGKSSAGSGVFGRRLRHYFQSFTILVMTDLPIQKVLKKLDVAGRMVKWAVEFSEFDIKYEPRGPIKGQIFADFVVELSSETVQNAGDGFRWVLSVDGSSNQFGSGAGVILEGPNDVLIEQSLRFAFKASNNQAEYEALIAGILLAKEMGARVLMAKSDLLLITGQVTGEFQAKDPQMAAYLEYVQELRWSFVLFEVVHVPREQNARANLLAKLASSGKGGR